MSTLKTLFARFCGRENQHNEKNVILQRMAEMEKRIMSAISDFVDKVNTSFDELGTAVDGVVSPRKTMKTFLSSVALCALLMCGCKTNPQITHAAFTAAVTLGEQIAVETHPEAVPLLRVAAPVVCAVAAGTNVSASEIVARLEAAGITDPTARIIINGSLALFNIAISGLSTNSSELRLYALDLCQGMTMGLPPEPVRARGPAALRRPPPPAKALPPHLK